MSFSELHPAASPTLRGGDASPSIQPVCAVVSNSRTDCPLAAKQSYLNVHGDIMCLCAEGKWTVRLAGGEVCGLCMNLPNWPVFHLYHTDLCSPSLAHCIEKCKDEERFLENQEFTVQVSSHQPAP